jgi:hypothetical protein
MLARLGDRDHKSVSAAHLKTILPSMKPYQFKLRCKKLYGNTPGSPAFTGFLLAMVVFALIGLSTNALTSATGAMVSASTDVQDELQIHLSVEGFTPSQVQHAAGTLAIAVHNANVSGEYTLRLKAGDGTVVKEVQVQEGSAAWTVTLSAGEYTLTEASHPQWLCRITVQ